MNPSTRRQLRALLESVPSGDQDRLREGVERLLQATSDSARKSEERLRRYFDLSLIGMAITSPDKGWLEVNDKLCEIFQLSREELIQKTWAELTHPDDLEADVAEFDKVLGGQQEGYSMDKRFVLADGEIVHASIDVRVLRDEMGEVDVFVALVHDITDRVRAETERHALEVQLLKTQKLESLGVLAGGIAHDFNNLLVGLMGNTGLALATMSPDDPAREYLHGIDVAAARAADLCSQMLAYSGKGHFVVEPVYLGALVDEMVHLIEAGITKNASIRIDFADDLPVVEADATQIRQIVMNLITNASEALDEAGGTITITGRKVVCDHEDLRALDASGEATPGTFAVIEVSDDGCGMAPDALEQIYEPFFSTKFTGRGLGLAAVLGIVRGHRGAISVRSELGRGTTFRVYLPGTTELPATLATPEPTAIESGQGGAVLFVDDNPLVRNLGRTILRTAGYSTVVASDGAEAIERFRAGIDRISCVVLDLTMPGMSGHEVHTALRQMRTNLPIVISSGYDESDVVGEFVDGELAGFLQKPYRPQDLISTVNAALAGARHNG